MRPPSALLVPRACLLLTLLLVNCSDVIQQTLVPVASGGSAGTTGGGGAVGTGGVNALGGTSLGGSEAGAGAQSGDGTGGTAETGGSGTGGEVTLPCPDPKLIGFASVMDGTTGGGAGKRVTATNFAELKMYATATEPYVIEIPQAITLTEQIRPKSKKTIVGVGTKGVITGGGFYILSASDIIIQNLTITDLPPGESDAITVEHSNYVWIDHCDLSTTLSDPSGTYDGLIDITHGSDFVTVSWTKLHDHYQVSVVGHSDNNALEDSGHLLVTWHHNFFQNVASSTPRVRFGRAHLFNNYYQNVSGNAISSQLGAEVIVEKNYFDNVPKPLTTSYSPDNGTAVWIDNDSEKAGGMPEIVEMSAWVPSSSYSYVTDSATSVPLLVSQCAGVGKGPFSAP